MMSLRRFIFEDDPRDEELKKSLRNFLRAVPLFLCTVIQETPSIIKEYAQDFLEDIAGETIEAINS